MEVIMKLTKVKICNFKSFSNEELICLEDFSAVIGANSSGKTSFFQALLKLFGETSKEREILRSDFHIPNNINPQTIRENHFYIEAVIEFPEVLESNGVEESTVPSFFENFVIESSDRAPYIRIRLEANWVKSNQPEGIIESNIFFIVAPEENEINEQQKKFINKMQLSLIKIIYIPALRNPAEQLKMVSGTILWRLINRINFDDSFKTDIDEQISNVHQIIDRQTGFSALKDIIKDQWKSYHNDKRYLNVDLNFNTNDIENILKKIDAKFSPTEVVNNYTVDSLGDGLRSLFYFSLVGSLIKTEELTLKEISENPGFDNNERTFSNTPPLLTILAVEEPENHVAPHLLGKIVKNLQGISKNNNSQVVLASHSASIIKRLDPIEIRHFRSCKEKNGTVVNKIKLPKKDDEAYTYVKEAVKAYPEIYFSGLVILGEGDSEEILLPKVFEYTDLDITSNEISIVPLGGRHVNHFWKLLNQLHIPHITLLDLDLERNGGGWGRIKYVIEQLILNGHSKEALFNLNSELVISEPELSEMHKWDLDSRDTDIDKLYKWVNQIESYNVFFSSPLDIDFLMLKNYIENYQAIMAANEGPRLLISGEKKKIINLEQSDINTTNYSSRLQHDIGRTLKDETKIGKYYSEKEKELMIWYNYFFLNRGKPSTHILAISQIDEDIFMGKLPDVFKRMLVCVNKKLITEGESNE
jgi:putative ATP-dependent endonuclease of the OLD family